MSEHHKTILARLNELEREFDVTALRYKSIRLWPLLRLMLTRALWQEIVPPRSYGKLVGFAKKLERRYPAVNNLMPLPGVAFRWGEYMRRRRLVERVEQEDPGGIAHMHGPVDALFLAKNNQRRDRVDGKLFNPFFNSLPFNNESGRSALMLEYSDDANYLTPRYGTSQLLDSRLAGAALKQSLRSVGSLLSGGMTSSKIEGWADFRRALNKLNLPFAATHVAVIDKVERILAYKKVFSDCLREYRPRALFFTCFYDEISFAAILACNDAGVDTVELQHGQQGDHHLMYTHWARVPREGYELIPTHFWMWGEPSKARLDAWCGGTTRHKVIMGGSSWLALWRDRDFETDEAREPAFRDVFKADVNVMVALQPVDQPLPDHLLRAIKLSPDHVKWFLRPHPRMRNRLPELKERLGALAARCEVERAGSMPLYGMLRHVKVCITLWSTVAYEALAFGARPVIIHPNGRTLMREFCENGSFVYTESAEGILDAINADDAAPAQDRQYIVADYNLVERTVDDLLAAHKN